MHIGCITWRPRGNATATRRIHLGVSRTFVRIVGIARREHPAWSMHVGCIKVGVPRLDNGA